MILLFYIYTYIHTYIHKREVILFATYVLYASKIYKFVMVFNGLDIKRQLFFTKRSTSFLYCPSKVKFRRKEKHVENWYGRAECCLIGYCVHALYFQEWPGTPKPQQPAFFGEPARRYDSSLNVCSTLICDETAIVCFLSWDAIRKCYMSAHVPKRIFYTCTKYSSIYSSHLTNWWNRV